MDSHNHYLKIRDSLNDILEDLERVDLDIYLKKFKDTDHFSNFEDDFKDFQYDVTSLTEECKNAIESPIYVGVVGHYSSGKSSLLNSILLPQKAREILPTGENPVTAKCSLIQFKEKKSGNIFFQRLVNGQEKSLPEESYQRMVSGSVSSALQDTLFFKLVVGTENLASGVFEQMATRHIELFDTPGLGGPYWNDQYALQEWIAQFKLIIVCIRVDQISDTTADSVNPFLKNSVAPIIPVITFWDIWDQCDLLKDISNEKKAQKKTKEELQKLMPSLGDALDRALFVSAKFYHEGIEPEKSDHVFSRDWNIDNVRAALSSFISDNKKILESQKNQDSMLEKSRKETVLQGGKQLISQFNSIEEHLKNRIESVRPKAEYEDDLDAGIDKFQDDLDQEYDRLYDKLDQIVSDEIGGLKVSGNINNAFIDLKTKVETTIKENLSGDVRQRLERSLERNVYRTLFRYLEDTPIGNKQQNRFKEDIQNIGREFLENNLKAPEEDIVKKPSGLSNLVMNTMTAIVAGIKDLALTNLPLALGVILVITIGPFIIPMVKLFLPQSVENQIMMLLYGSLIIFIVCFFFSRIKAAKEKTTLEIKDKARKINRRVDLKKRLATQSSKGIQDFRRNLKETIIDYLQDTIENSDSMLTEIEELLIRIKQFLKIVEKECRAIERTI